MVFPNKPDEDWYWPFEILYTSAFFMLFDQPYQMFFFTLEYIGLNDIRVQVGIVQPKGGGNSAYERGGDARRKFWIKPLKETDLGVAQTFYDP